VLGIELLFGSGGFFEVLIDIDHCTTDLAHGSPPRMPACASDGVPTSAEGLRPPARFRWV
jgi:hypothetical protein